MKDIIGYVLCIGIAVVMAVMINGSAGILIALILVLAIGIKYGANDAISIGFTSLSGLAIAALAGIFLNAVLPGKDYEFGSNEQGDTSVSFGNTFNKK